MVQWAFNIPIAGNYSLEVEFAAQDVRSVQIDIDSKLFLAQGLAEATGGWFVDKQKFIKQGNDVYLSAGSHTIRFTRANVFPHLRTLAIYAGLAWGPDYAKCRTTDMQYSTAHFQNLPRVTSSNNLDMESKNPLSRKAGRFERRRVAQMHDLNN